MTHIHILISSFWVIKKVNFSVYHDKHVLNRHMQIHFKKKKKYRVSIKTQEKENHPICGTKYVHVQYNLIFSVIIDNSYFSALLSYSGMRFTLFILSIMQIYVFYLFLNIYFSNARKVLRIIFNFCIGIGYVCNQLWYFTNFCKF